MTFILIMLHVFSCVALILIVLLQKGKGASMGAVFGGSSQAVFGSTGATSFLHKVTTAIAIIFMLTSLSLSFFLVKRPSSSVMEGVTPTQQAPAPEKGAAPAPGGQAPAQPEPQPKQ